MSTPHLLPELLDHIVDFLRSNKRALKECCLVSKSWIPRTRRLLFVHVRFSSSTRLESWKETFPDPSRSPAQYTKTLTIECPQAVTASDAEAGGWIRGFSHVVHFEVFSRSTNIGSMPISLLSFHGFSAAIRSLRVSICAVTSSQVFDLILSFPLLEDLDVAIRNSPIDNGDGLSTIIQSSNPPMTGSLTLFRLGGIGSIARRLLSLSGGIHFRKLALKWCREEDVSLTMALVEKCSHTLESLEIGCNYFGASVRHPRLHWQLISVSS